MAQTMKFHVTRIILKTGELVIAKEDSINSTRFEGVVPVIGDIINVTCRGRSIKAKVIWGHWPDSEVDENLFESVPLRVEEI